MASGQHTQVRDWAVQHWKNPGHTVRAPEFQVSSSLGLQLLLSWQGVQGKRHWSSSETVYSPVHGWGTYRQCGTKTHWSTAYRRHVFPAQKRRGWVIYSQNLQKLYQRILSLNTSAVQKRADIQQVFFYLMTSKHLLAFTRVKVISWWNLLEKQEFTAFLL